MRCGFMLVRMSDVILANGGTPPLPAMAAALDRVPIGARVRHGLAPQRLRSQFRRSTAGRGWVGDIRRPPKSAHHRCRPSDGTCGDGCTRAWFMCPHRRVRPRGAGRQPRQWSAVFAVSRTGVQSRIVGHPGVNRRNVARCRHLARRLRADGERSKGTAPLPGSAGQTRGGLAGRRPTASDSDARTLG